MRAAAAASSATIGIAVPACLTLWGPRSLPWRPRHKIQSIFCLKRASEASSLQGKYPQRPVTDPCPRSAGDIRRFARSRRSVPLRSILAGFPGSFNRFYDTHREGGPLMEPVCWPMRCASSSIWLGINKPIAGRIPQQSPSMRRYARPVGVLKPCAGQPIVVWRSLSSAGTVPRTRLHGD